MNFKLGELYCGPGGLAVGAKNAKVVHNKRKFEITHTWANDNDRDACNTYIKNICPESPNKVICEDVRKLDIAKLPPINALAFGFPCNDFSIVGEQNGLNGSYGPLYSYGVKAIQIFNPDWFLAENVGGLKNANEGKAFNIIIKRLQNAGKGYNLVANLYKFEDYSIPQSRHRIIIVGIRSDLNLNFKVPFFKNSPLITCKQAIEVPPILNDAYNHEFTKNSETVVKRLMAIKPGENAFNANLPENLKLNVKGAKISQIYKRLHPDRPAYTVTGSGGGGTHIYHWSEPRALTNRERARLQTFPDGFIFTGSKESVRKQIGMAVPPKGAQIIFEAILKTFAGVPYENVLPNIDINNLSSLKDLLPEFE